MEREEEGHHPQQRPHDPPLTISFIKRKKTMASPATRPKPQAATTSLFGQALQEEEHEGLNPEDVFPHREGADQGGGAAAGMEVEPSGPSEAAAMEALRLKGEGAALAEACKDDVIRARAVASFQGAVSYLSVVGGITPAVDYRGALAKWEEALGLTPLDASLHEMKVKG